MGLMDKVRAQAPVLAQKTQEIARDSKVKFDQVQAKRRADIMLHDLGAAVYAQRTDRATPSTQADVDRLIADLKAHEAENGLNLRPESGESGDTPGSAPPGPASPGPGPSGPGPSGGPAGGPAGDPPDASGTTTQV
ncbi:MAG TPA: hypothetical protein VHY31_23560 [Streptosporangiaceae bacterium]|jgi:hypothetical protein|nr:hypothetical protein [Streptosporangiaceae bacterium]